MAGIKSINELLLNINLDIPDYQRPYKWSTRNISELLSDIETAIEIAQKDIPKFKYRIGTIILHKKDGKYHIVDGQQRIISLVLIKKHLEGNFPCTILEKGFSSKISQTNIHQNYTFINEWFTLRSDAVREAFKKALDDILEVVVLTVNCETEAFQLFDSQNARGKELDPHDLLKAYHLREMKQNQSEMKDAVTEWEAKKTSDIRALFGLYLFPICNWARGFKSHRFSAKEIDMFKGINENSPYAYAERTRKAMPCFQITEPFVAGRDFFKMTEYYLEMLCDIKENVKNEFKEIDKIIETYPHSTGFNYAVKLFYCALLCYYDRFRNFDPTAVKKLFVWALMLRVDMESLGFSSINKYAIGEGGGNYSNVIPMFLKICSARTHYEISGLVINMNSRDANRNKVWAELNNSLKGLMGMEV